VKSVRPNLVSILAIARLTAGCEIPSRWAAPVVLRSTMTAQITSRSRRNDQLPFQLEYLFDGFIFGMIPLSMGWRMTSPGKTIGYALAMFHAVDIPPQKSRHEALMTAPRRYDPSG